MSRVSMGPKRQLGTYSQFLAKAREEVQVMLLVVDLVFSFSWRV